MIPYENQRNMHAVIFHTLCIKVAYYFGICHNSEMGFSKWNQGERSAIRHARYRDGIQAIALTKEIVSEPTRRHWLLDSCEVNGVL